MIPNVPKGRIDTVKLTIPERLDHPCTLSRLVLDLRPCIRCCDLGIFKQDPGPLARADEIEQASVNQAEWSVRGHAILVVKLANLV